MDTGRYPDADRHPNARAIVAEMTAFGHKLAHFEQTSVFGVLKEIDRWRTAISALSGPGWGRLNP